MSRRVIFVDPAFWTTPKGDNMNEESDLSEGFPEHQKPPRDVVPKAPISNPTDIPTGPATVVSYDLDDDGITRTEERVFTSRPVMPKTTGD